jgi:hypothetical protein
VLGLKRVEPDLTHSTTRAAQRIGVQLPSHSADRQRCCTASRRQKGTTLDWGELWLCQLQRLVRRRLATNAGWGLGCCGMPDS